MSDDLLEFIRELRHVKEVTQRQLVGIEWYQPRNNSRPSCPACQAFQPTHAEGCWIADFLGRRGGAA